MEKPLVSVTVLVYNGENTIRKTIDSILNQTYQNIEVILVDDASTDQSRNIIDSYDDVRIKREYLDRNHNICYAGNFAFDKSKGKYIAIIGHDDLWEPDKIEKQVEYLESHEDVAVCFTRVDIIDENDNIVNEKHIHHYNLFNSDNRSKHEWQFTLLTVANHFCAPSALLRKEALDITGGYRYGLLQLQDYDLWLRLLTVGNIYILDEKLTKYRRFSDNQKNMSSDTPEVRNRDAHEKNWVVFDYILKLNSMHFKNIFGQYFRNAHAEAEYEIRCEKAFILQSLENCFAFKYFIELLEDEQCREYLEDKCKFTLNDFYKINGKTVKCDNSLADMVRIQRDMIEKYNKILRTGN